VHAEGAIRSCRASSVTVRAMPASARQSEDVPPPAGRYVTGTRSPKVGSIAREVEDPGSANVVPRARVHARFGRSVHAELNVRGINPRPIQPIHGTIGMPSRTVAACTCAWIWAKRKMSKRW